MNDSDLIDVETLDFEDDQVWLYKTPDDSGDKVDIVDWCLSLDWPRDDEYNSTEKKLYEIMDDILNNHVMSMPDKHKFDSRTYVKPKKLATRPSLQQFVASDNPTSPFTSISKPAIRPIMQQMVHESPSKQLIRPGTQPVVHESPSKQAIRPSLQQTVHDSQSSPFSSLSKQATRPIFGSDSPFTSLANSKYLTYNKYSTPLGPILRHKTFNVDSNTANSGLVKDYALKRKSLMQDDDPQLEDMDMTFMDISERLSSEHAPSKPINIDLSQPAHNLHNTFNKVPNMLLNDRGSLNMYQSGESLMRMSPPSLVGSLMMDSSGTFNQESLDGRKSQATHPDSGLPTSGRDSIDPMTTSMTLSILDDKDMSTSFLSQTTYPDHDSLIDSLPPSLVNSVNSSYITKPRPEKPERKLSESNSNNVFSSATFTHLEQSERLLSARPRCSNMFGSLKKSSVRNSESYTKAREEGCQIDQAKILNENGGNGNDMKTNMAPQNSKIETKISYVESRKDSAEEITLHYANNKFKTKEVGKENMNASFEKDDAFYKDMGMTRTVDLGKNSLNVTLDKQELNEIIQARHKLSLARKGLPVDSARPLPNQVDTTETSSNAQMKAGNSIDDQLAAIRALNGYSDTLRDEREGVRRDATFHRPSPRAVDTTVIYLKAEDRNIIDINKETDNLVDCEQQAQSKEEWGSQEPAMVRSSSSTDTGTFSTASPPDSVPDTRAPPADIHIASTPLTAAKRTAKSDLMGLHNTISPIYNMVDDKSYTVTKAPSYSNGTYDVTRCSNNTTVINSGTIVKKTAAKRDILGGRSIESPEKRVLNSPPARVPAPVASHTSMAPPAGLPRKTALPTSKLRQYSSHRELRIPVVSNAPAGPAVGRPSVGRTMVRRNVYASNPALSPSAPPVRPNAYTIATDEKPAEKPVPTLVRQGTETLRRERPQSQLVQPKDLRPSTAGGPGFMRNHHGIQPPTRPHSTAGASQVRVNRPTSGVTAKQTAAPILGEPIPRPASSSNSDARISALPRPTRLPAPRARLRPPSAYSVAPAANTDHY